MLTKGLAFSGGKDSWACLWLHKDQLDDIAVLWVNTGKNFPELLETINKARAMCPSFHEILVDRDRQNSTLGLPADVVPINWTVLGQIVTGPKPTRIQSYLGCCYDNISMPLHMKAKELGLTQIIRGQRNDDGHKGSARNGTVFDGITCLHPIENWTAPQVLSFVSEHMELPGHFGLKHSSMDCFDCTAYRKECADKTAYMRERHPGLYEQYKVRSDALDAALLAAQ